MAEDPLALVTGASRGIGAAVAHALAPTHRLLLGGRDTDALARQAAEITAVQPGRRVRPEPGATGTVDQPGTALSAVQPGRRVRPEPGATGTVDQPGTALSAVQPGRRVRPEHRGTAEPWPVDLADPDAVRAATASIGRLDVLVHSAGVAELGTVAEASAEAWRANLEVNLIAVVELTRALLPALRAARGHVVVINSGAGLNARPGWGPYAASKFAARAFADVLRAEEEAGGLRVTSVYPGRTDTEMQQAVVAGEGGEYDPDRFLRPESVAEAVRGAVTATPDAHPTEIVLRPRPR